MVYDLVIYNGVVVTASDILPPSIYIGINNGIIETMTTQPLKGKREIDCEGAYITPGGIDSHVHLDQDNAPTGDDFDSGSRSAIAGGTTTILPFAIQPKKENTITGVVKDYHQRANKKGGSYCDYGFHLIISEPNEEMLTEEFPEIIAQEGITSVKVYTTYPRYKLTDNQLLNVLLANRKLGVTTMIHAENSDIIDFINEQLQKKNLTDPFYHSISRPLVAEEEASYRVIALAKLIDVPILIVHMSSKTAMDHVRKAQTDNIPIYSETCPQYLFLTADYLKPSCIHHLDPHDAFEGAKYICSPPLRQEQSELDAIWDNINNGTVTVFSSDHAPTTYDDPQGKKAGIINGIPHYKSIPNGLPGIETRVPLLFCFGVETQRISPQKFVELTSTNAAKLYGLHNKGTIGVGFDGDITIWYPKNKVNFKLSNSMLHHSIDYTPYEGMQFTNWPRYTILRGEVIYDRDNGGVIGSKSGQYLKRHASSLRGPLHDINSIFK